MSDSTEENGAKNVAQQEDGVVTALQQLLPTELVTQLEERDGAAILAEELPNTFTASEVVSATSEASRAWELVGIYYLQRNRFFEAISVFSGLYYQLLAAQAEAGQMASERDAFGLDARCISAPAHACTRHALPDVDSLRRCNPIRRQYSTWPERGVPPSCVGAGAGS